MADRIDKPTLRPPSPPLPAHRERGLGGEGSIATTVLYGIAPRCFDPPGFAGVAARLDDLADLGVSALWLAPVTRTLPGDFGYAVTDYFDVRPDYGTKAELAALVRAAHDRGLRVVLDVAPNHTSAAHPWFQEAERYGPAAPSWHYYHRDEAGQPTHYFDWSHLPNLNFAHPEVQRLMLEVFRYWLRECDVDGFRVDAVWGIKERQPEWIARLVAEVKRIKPDALLIAEASARDPFYAEQGFTAAYDWTDRLGQWAWDGVFDGTTPVGEAMTAALTSDGRGAHPHARVMRFLNNNDTGVRFITTHGAGCYRVALAMLLTLPGLPCLYTGDEVGAEYLPYDRNDPGALDWTDRHGLLLDIKKLFALRRGLPALHSRSWQPLAVAPAASSFAYLRTGEGAQAPVAVLLNFSPDAVDMTVALLETAAFGAGEPIDLWSGERIAAPATSKLTVSVPAWGFRLLTPGHA